MVLSVKFLPGERGFLRRISWVMMNFPLTQNCLHRWVEQVARAEKSGNSDKQLRREIANKVVVLTRISENLAADLKAHPDWTVPPAVRRKLEFPLQTARQLLARLDKI